ncbi:MAG TPA: LptF/LptG family permease [Syntrophorhabdaceae bacterium]|nr:LptF/LptG family permease [Syntrophorhabdaceae bacterium]
MLDYAVHILTKLHKKFYIYVLKELSYIMLLSLGILTFILVLSRLGKMTDLVINKGVDVKDIVLLILYSSPTYLTFTLPMAFLLSVIVVLGRLSTENEVLVLKASGIDLKCFFVPISAIAVIITFCGLLNSNVLLPKSSELFRNTLINIIKKGISIEDKEGVFNDTIPGVVIYVDKVDVQKRILSGVMVSDDRDKEVKQTIAASTGYINVDPVTLDLYFVLENGNLHRWEKSKDVYRSVTFQNYTFSMNLSTMLPHSSELRKRSYEMDRSELQKSLLTANASERYDIFLDIYKKISIPFSSLAFIFLTIPLGVKRRVEGKFSGILYSLLLFIFYYVLIAITDNIGQFINLPPFITSFTPNIVIAAMGLYLLRNLNEEEHSTVQQKLRQIWMFCLEKTK